MVKQSEIAKIAGVSISTVSRVLNHSTDISLKTIEHVTKIAEELGYTTKKKFNKKNIIAVIVPELISLYYSELVHTLETRIRAKGFNMLISLSGFSIHNVANHLTSIDKGDISGIICFISTIPEDDSILGNATKNLKVPVIFLSDGAENSNDEYDYIFLNQRSGVSQVLDHLVNLGHKKIGFIGEYNSISRLTCLEGLMEAKGLTLNHQFVKMGNTRFEKGGYEQMKLLMSEPDLPTAVIASYDQIAIGALKAIDEVGLSVPDDISIIGFDNIVTNEFLPRKLTSVSNPIANMGQIATRLLFDKIFKPENSVIQSVSLHPTLIIRETTKKNEEIKKTL